MRKLYLPLIVLLLSVVAVFGWLGVARGQTPPTPDGEVVLNTESRDGNTRQITGPQGAPANNAPDAPNISFIDSPTAACVQPDPAQNVCYINWYYMSVSASTSQYIITMTVRLNDLGNVANYSGFFQTSMYVPYNMSPNGYKVECGALGAGGAPEWGKAYAYTIRARETGGLGSANYGTVYCPAFTP
jgi:hypothetical protein